MINKINSLFHKQEKWLNWRLSNKEGSIFYDSSYRFVFCLFSLFFLKNKSVGRLAYIQEL